MLMKSLKSRSGKKVVHTLKALSKGVRANRGKNLQLSHEDERMSTEIPIWVNGKIRWLSGVDKRTTCKDIVEVLLDGENLNKSEAKDFVIMERWRKVERQLDENSKILKIWTHWGNEKKEVRLCLRRIDNEVDSGRGSPVGYTPSLRRKRNRIRGNGKPPWAYKESLHPRRLAELETFDDYSQIKTDQSELVNNKQESFNDLYSKKIYDDNKSRGTENVNIRKTSGHKSYHCSGTGRLHSTPFSENHSKRPKCCSKRDPKQKIRNSENIEKLMKLILAQGATIQSQLQKLKEREEQIELLEQERHRERIEKNGRNYLLETYLGSLKDAEVPQGINDIEDENDVLAKTNSHEWKNFSEAESSVIKGNKIYEKSESNNRENGGVSPKKSQSKSIRSKSESRAQERKLEGNLKRTLSDNALDETNANDKKEVSPELVKQNTKEENEDVIELKRIQSQIEMWEKVFKINKKLEKEEENLVRLYIKIKKIQSENYRITGENQESDKKENKDTISSPISEKLQLEIMTEEKNQYEQDCTELEKNLELLKSDLEHNSKEIYKNFTRLIEEDEIVAQKRSCLSKIMTDLERTNHEHEMLNEMITMREDINFRKNQFENEVNFNRGLPFENHMKKENEFAGDSKIENQVSEPEALQQIQESVNQRTEIKIDDQENHSKKSKILKISFEDQIQNYESSDTSLYRDPTAVPTGALKSILKNRRNGINKICNLNNQLQKFQGLSKNYEINNDEVKVQTNYTVNNSCLHPYPTNVPNHVTSTNSYGIPYPLYVNYPNDQSQFFNGQLTKLSENFKNVSLLKNSHPQEIIRNSFPQSTIVTTKALVHNDTDSSTSSDTSGLSSLYSGSTTAEEPFVEKSYALDTLV